MNFPTVSEQLSIIKQNSVDILPEQELINKLELSISQSKPLVIKLGLDPSRPDIHIGHSVVLNKLRQFQDLGHSVSLIIGDFTAMIGDPTGKSKTRIPLTLEETRDNGKTYVDQASKILDISKTTVLYNSEWLNKLNFQDVINLSAKYTVAQLLERDDFMKRYKNKTPIGVHEFLYPLSQAFDSVIVKPDIEIGGTDQKFNLLVGREIMRSYDLEPQCIITMPIIEGIDGSNKMSKSLNNYIGLTENPKDMFGKIMSIPDELILKYFKYVCYYTSEQITNIESDITQGILHPKDAKINLAKAIISKYHNSEIAEHAHEEFNNIFLHKNTPEDVRELIINTGSNIINIVELLYDTELVKSKSEARRLIESGAVRVDGLKIVSSYDDIDLSTPKLIRVGKLKFLKISASN